MADRGIAGDALGQNRQSFEIALDQEPFNPPVLIAQLDFQVKHTLADAVETKMAGLDHAGVHRPHRHLVDLFTLHSVVRVSARDVFGVVVPE